MTREIDDRHRRLMELEELLKTTREIRRSAGPADTDEKAFALASLRLAEDAFEGVVSELSVEPPRPLNAIRLARHIWEAEVELHYVEQLGEDGVRQIKARECDQTIKAARALHGPDNWETLKEAPIWAERKRLLDDAKNRDKAHKSARRNSSGAPSSMRERGTVPNRRQMLEELGRGDEMGFYYAIASYYSHPSLTAMSNLITVSPEGEAQGPIEGASDMYSMAGSFARMAIARLALRAGEILEADQEQLDKLRNWMQSYGIGQTGIAPSD